MCKIYGLIDPWSEQIRYVGQTTKKLKDRLKEHIRKHNNYKNLHFKYWISKIIKSGFMPKTIILQQNAIWNKDEVSWIEKLRKDGVKLLNATNGGDGMLGFKHSQDSKLKISLSKIGKSRSEETKSKISNSLSGRIISKESLKKAQRSRVGKKHSNSVKKIISKANSKKVQCVETEVIYESVVDAKNKTDIWNIANCCRGLYKSAGGYTWRYI